MFVCFNRICLALASNPSEFQLALNQFKQTKKQKSLTENNCHQSHLKKESASSLKSNPIFGAPFAEENVTKIKKKMWKMPQIYIFDSFQIEYAAVSVWFKNTLKTGYIFSFVLKNFAKND